MKTLFENIVVAFAMYSKIPVPKREWSEENMRWCMCAFPLIGAVIALAEFLWMKAALYLGTSEILRGAVMAAIPVLITGGIHLDGMLDTFDALASWKTPEEKLEIMKDSHSGAFAIIACATFFTLYLGALCAASPSETKLIGLGFILSRALSGFGVVKLRKAKDSGLLRTFSDAAAANVVSIVMLCWFVLVSIVILWIDPIKGGLQILLAVLMFMWYRWMAYRQFGGITGDVAGYFLQVCELLMALGVVIV